MMSTEGGKVDTHMLRFGWFGRWRLNSAAWSRYIFAAYDMTRGLHTIRISTCSIEEAPTSAPRQEALVVVSAAGIFDMGV